MGPVRSIVQQYFIKLNSDVSVCEFCQKEIKTCGNTTNLRLHLYRKHRDNPDLAEFVSQFPPPVTYKRMRPTPPQDGTNDQLMSHIKMENCAAPVTEQHQSTLQTVSPVTQSPSPVKPAGLKKFFMRKNEEQNNKPVFCEKVQTIKMEDEFDYIGKNVSVKLRSLPKEQRIYAEKLISDILFEAELGTLNRSCSLVNGEKTNCYPSVEYISPSVEMHPNPAEDTLEINSQMNSSESDHGYMQPEDKNRVTH